MTETPSHLPFPLPQRKRPGWYRGEIRISHSALFENFINFFVCYGVYVCIFLGIQVQVSTTALGHWFFFFFLLPIGPQRLNSGLSGLMANTFTLSAFFFILYLKLFIFYVWASCLHYICASHVCLVAVEARRWCVSRIKVRSADPETRAIACPLCAFVELFQDGLKFQILQWTLGRVKGQGK